MNIILFEVSEIDSPLSRDDYRAIHIFNVLKRKVGETIDVGIINGTRGKALLKSVNEAEVEFDFEWNEEPAPLLPIDLIVGLPRPQTCRKILQQATSLGVRSISFCRSFLGERSYATSKLWNTNEWERIVRTGVEQAYTTRFPNIQFGLKLADCFEATKSVETRICLDNYESPLGLWTTPFSSSSIVLAIGSERGWTVNELSAFREHGFDLAHLGERPLRTETATVAAISLIAARLQSG